MPSKVTEGDVEVHAIVPLFFDADRLRFRREQLKSKQFLASKDIGKGRSSRKGYVPDFCIYEQSLPVLVIEAKAPNEDAFEAYKEASLYSNLPEWVLLRVLMRQDYRFFTESSGFIHNIFDCETNSKRPSNFIRIEILFHLIGARKKVGENGLLGFVASSTIMQRMEHLGFVDEDVRGALNTLLVQGLLESDTFSDKVVAGRASVRATASAWAHMRLLPSRIEYVSSVLPTTPIADPTLVAKVESALTDESRLRQLSLNRRLNLVADFRKYLSAEYQRHRAHPGYANIDRTGAAYVLDKVTNALEFGLNGRSDSGQLDLLDS